MVASLAPATLDQEIAVYNSMQEELKERSFGKWVVICHRQLQGVYDDFDSAAGFAVSTFGRGPYLIRQIGEGELSLPTSVLYISSHDAR